MDGWMDGSVWLADAVAVAVECVELVIVGILLAFASIWHHVAVAPACVFVGLLWFACVHPTAIQPAGTSAGSR